MLNAWGGGGSYTHFYNLSLRTSHVLSPEGGLGGRFFLWGGHIVLKGKDRQQSLRRTVEIYCQSTANEGEGNHK